MLPRLPHPCFPHPCLPHPRLTLTLTRLPCVAKPFDPDDSNLDEIVGYVLAAAGFVFQLQAGIHMASMCRRIFDDTHAMTTRYTALACMYHIVAS